MTKVLITGVSGFAGAFLAEYLQAFQKYQIFGTFLAESSLEALNHLKSKLTLEKIDLIDAPKVDNLIKKVKPDQIFHLAALTSPADSFRHPREVISNNITAQINILEGAKNHLPKNSKILIVSSAEVYGLVNPQDLPISEKVELRPASPYAVSKITQDYLGLQYFLAYKLNIIRVRPFNHIGPRQSSNFVVSAFARRIAEIEKGRIKPVLKVGNLNSKRDLTDVRDMVVAYSLSIEKGRSGEVYNIGSGRSYKIENILNKLLDLANMRIKVEVDPSLLRPKDTPELLCDNQKFVETTGWQPTIPIEKTLKDTLDYWRNIV